MIIVLDCLDRALLRAAGDLTSAARQAARAEILLAARAHGARLDDMLAGRRTAAAVAGRRAVAEALRKRSPHLWSYRRLGRLLGVSRSATSIQRAA